LACICRARLVSLYVYFMKVMNAEMHIKKILAVLFCGMLAGKALAGTGGDIRCWTTNSGEVYHIRQSCVDEETFPISESAAVAFGKKPCPDCVEIEDKPVLQADFDIRMAVRGGSYILIIPDGDIEGVQVPQTGESEKTYSGADADNEVRRLLTREAYGDFSARFEADGWAHDTARRPEVLIGEGDLCMSCRLVDDNWYIALRPKKSYGTETEVRWQVAEYDVRRENADAVTVVGALSGEYAQTVAIENHGDAETVFEKDYSILSLTVYRESGINTAVIRDLENHAEMQARLWIGDLDTGTVLRGYQDNQKRPTFCCVLSDVELGHIVAGKMPDLVF